MPGIRTPLVFVLGCGVGLLVGRVNSGSTLVEPPGLSPSPVWSAPPSEDPASSPGSLAPPIPVDGRQAGYLPPEGSNLPARNLGERLHLLSSDARLDAGDELALLEGVVAAARSDEGALHLILRWIGEAPDGVAAWLASRLRDLKSPAVEAAAADLIRSGNGRGFLLLSTGEAPSPATCEALAQAVAQEEDPALRTSALQHLPAPYLEGFFLSGREDLRLEAMRGLITHAPNLARRGQVLLEALADPSPAIQDMALDTAGDSGLEGPEADAVTQWLLGRLNDPASPLDVRVKAALAVQKLEKHP